MTAERRGKDENAAIAARLSEYADLLEQQGADGFRVRAYREGAAALAALDRPVSDIHEEGGRRALVALPAIGTGIAGAIIEMLATGRWGQLERLKGELSPEQVFQTIPGIGPKLAAKLAGEAHLETLEELEAALALGTPEIPFLGERRRKAISAVLAERLARKLRATRKSAPQEEPGVALLLEADALYRKRAAAGELRRIAPRRFNPEGEAWLPIMHARHEGWHFTLLFSNTALAHQLGRTHDWVVAYFERDGGGPEGRRTIVTETRGPLEGKRVVRGREAECRAYYAAEGEIA